MTTNPVIILPEKLTFTNTSSGASTYNWDFGITTSTNVNVSLPFVNSTSSNITQTVQLIATTANLCMDTIIIPIVIHPKPEYSIISLPDSGCTPLLVKFSPIQGAVN